MILYFGGHMKWATILECPYGHGLMFRSNVVVYMSISHVCTFVLDKSHMKLGVEIGKQ